MYALNNLVLVDRTLTIVESVTKTGINFTTFNLESYHEISFEDIKPIVLNNYFKGRFGFISEDFEIWYFDKNHDIYLIGNEFWFRGTCLRLVEYVHQLQDLYFALVGEELVLQD